MSPKGGTSKQTQGGVRYKSLTFRTSSSWTAGKGGLLEAEGREPLRVSAPEVFLGESGAWTPEDLLVASVESCHMATFLAHASRRQLPVRAYRSHSNGVLEHQDGHYRFTRIVIFPTITVAGSVSEAEVHALLREAQEQCLVTNSLASLVEVNPTILME